MMMIFHTYVVICTLIGIDVVWNSQCRDGRVVPWGEAIRCTLPITVCALIWGTLSYLYAQNFFLWTLPVLFGLVLAAPVIRGTSSFKLGQWLKKCGLLSTQSENNAPLVITNVEDYEVIYSALLAQQVINTLAEPHTKSPLPLPKEAYNKMPVQQF